MFDRSFGLLTATATFAVLLLALPSMRAADTSIAVNLSVQPVTVGVEIATRPLDLARLSLSDFGDNETIR